ncbi:LytR C-terminal domain-containing protein [bacterium]|nr:LytR C-terminal domain-containing protein [bacterium]
MSDPVSEPVRENPVTVEEKQPRVQPAETQAVPILTAADVKLQILNGCGVSGIAARVRGIMRDRGFDVMSYGNAEKNEPKTLLLVRSEGERGLQAAHITAASIGVAEAQIRREMDSSIVDIDVTIIVGGDHRSLNLE